MVKKTKSAPKKSGWEAIVAAVGASRAKLGIAVPDELHVPGIDATIAVQALHLELGKAKRVGIVEFLHALMEVEGTALDALGEHLAHAWIESDRASTVKWLVDSAGAIGGTRTAALFGGFVAERIHDMKAHHQVTAVVEGLWRMWSLAGAHEILMLADTPSRYVKRREEARALFVEIAKRHKLSPAELALRCAPREADAAGRTRIEALWARRCERMMVDGARLAFGELRTHVLEHPIRGPLTSRMIFGSGRDKQFSGSFRWARGGPIDAKGDRLALDDNTIVGVAHPVELRELDHLQRWQAALAQQDADQPFLQLQRTIRALSSTQASTNELRDFRYYRREWLHEQGWEARKIDSDWMGDADCFAITMARDKATIECRLDGDTTIRSIAIKKGTFGSLSSVSQSELLYAFLGQDDVARTAAPASRYPYAELAKTGRSTCLQCEAKIEHNTVRVAVEREIDSDTYRGTGAGYLHAACSAVYLAGLADRDRVIAANSEIPWP